VGIEDLLRRSGILRRIYDYNFFVDDFVTLKSAMSSDVLPENIFPIIIVKPILTLLLK